MEQIALLTREGVPADRIVIGHLAEQRSIADVLDVARTGVFIEVDHVGALQTQFQPESQRVQNVVALVRAGHLDQMLLGMDICKRSQLYGYGGNGYGYLFRMFVPMLREVGLTEREVSTILVDNPRRVLAF